MTRLGFQEKMLWAQLAGILIVGVYYVHYLAHAGAGHHYFHAVLLGMLLLFATARIFFRRGSGNVVEDERDHAIAAIGTRWSNLILWLGLVVILVMYWDHGSMRSANYLIGVLFHLMLLAGIARIVRELVAYRTAA